MMHILSLLFGLVSWGLACVAIGKRGGYGLCFGSMTLSALPLLLQLYELKRLLLVKEDVSAAMDTVNAVCFAGTVLVAVTLVLNGIAFIRGWRNRK